MNIYILTIITYSLKFNSMRRSIQRIDKLCLNQYNIHCSYNIEQVFLMWNENISSFIITIQLICTEEKREYREICRILRKKNWQKNRMINGEWQNKKDRNNYFIYIYIYIIVNGVSIYTYIYNSRIYSTTHLHIQTTFFFILRNTLELQIL